jgi:hypothetical protein
VYIYAFLYIYMNNHTASFPRVKQQYSFRKKKFHPLAPAESFHAQPGCDKIESPVARRRLAG